MLNSALNMHRFSDAFHLVAASLCANASMIGMFLVLEASVHQSMKRSLTFIISGILPLSEKMGPATLIIC